MVTVDLTYRQRIASPSNEPTNPLGLRSIGGDTRWVSTSIAALQGQYHIPLDRCYRCNRNKCNKVGWCSTCDVEVAATGNEFPEIGDIEHCPKCHCLLRSPFAAFEHLLKGCWNYWDITAIPRTNKIFSPNWRSCWMILCSAIHTRNDECLWMALIAMMPLLRKKAGDTPPHECSNNELSRQRFINYAWHGRGSDWQGDRMSIAVCTAAGEIMEARDNKRHFLRSPIVTNPPKRSKPAGFVYPLHFEYQRLANKAYSEIQKSERSDRHHGIVDLPQNVKRIKNEASERRLRRRSVKRLWCAEERRFISTWSEEEQFLAEDAGILDAIWSREKQKEWIRQRISDPLDQKIVWLRRGRLKNYKTAGWKTVWRSCSSIAKRLGIGHEKVKYRLEQLFHLFEKPVMSGSPFGARLQRDARPISHGLRRKINRRIESLRGKPPALIAEIILGEFATRVTDAEILFKLD